MYVGLGVSIFPARPSLGVGHGVADVVHEQRSSFRAFVPRTERRMWRDVPVSGADGALQRDFGLARAHISFLSGGALSKMALNNTEVGVYHPLHRHHPARRTVSTSQSSCTTPPKSMARVGGPGLERHDPFLKPVRTDAMTIRSIFDIRSLDLLGYDTAAPSDKATRYGPPAVPDRAGTLRSRSGAWWWFVPPGVCIGLLVISGFLIGRGYEEITTQPTTSVAGTGVTERVADVARERPDELPVLLVNHQESEPIYYIDKWLGKSHTADCVVVRSLLARADSRSSWISSRTDLRQLCDDGMTVTDDDDAHRSLDDGTGQFLPLCFLANKSLLLSIVGARMIPPIALIVPFFQIMSNPPLIGGLTGSLYDSGSRSSSRTRS